MDRQTKDCYHIVLESPKCRPMDISPRELSEELCCSVNTIKSRMKQTELNYEISASSHYQLFNYECLPILKAYLKSNRWKESTRESMSDFLSRVMSLLENNLDQSFCKYYLYNDPFFRKHVLKADLYTPIVQRLDIIKNLADRLAVEPIVRESNPHYPQSPLNILSELDQIIFKMSNFVNTETTKPASCADKNTEYRERTVTELVTYWCNDLIQKRMSLENVRGEIFLDISKNSSGPEIKAALNNRLMRETLDKQKTDYAQKFESQHVQNYSYNKAMEELDNRSPDVVKGNIEPLMKQNATAYLKAIFEGRTAPEFSCTEEPMLSPMMVSIVESWYNQLLAIASRMERIISTVLMILLLERKQSIWVNDMDMLWKDIELSLNPVSCIRDFWEVMEKSQYVSSDKGLANAFSDAINQANLSDQRFGTKKHKDELNQHFCSLLNKDRHVLPLNVILALCAVTLETFMEKHAQKYANYYAKIFEQYQSIIRTYIKK